MVSLREVRESNANLKTTLPNPTAFFAGGTSGIGEGAVKALAKHTSSKIYFAARNPDTAARLVQELKTLNAEGEYIPIPAKDLTLLKDVDKVCDELKSKESKLDLVCLSQGWVDLAGRNETPEGISDLLSICYYSRMRFVTNLLPLLNAAPNPHVVSILAGGQEGHIFPDDLALRHHYGVLNGFNAAATMNTLFLERLAHQEPRISFIHAYPGFVASPMFTDGKRYGSPVLGFLTWVLAPLFRLLMTSPDDAGERALFYGTSGRYGRGGEDGVRTEIGSNGVEGSGCYALDEKGEPKANQKVLEPLREKGVDEKIWDHTFAEFDRVAAM